MSDTQRNVAAGIANDGLAMALADVEITDANGRKVYAQTNEGGVFWFSYTGRSFPLTVRVDDPARPGRSWLARMATEPSNPESVAIIEGGMSFKA
ncbi:MAG: hypothetical protein JO142_16680 [Burkholderiales bacterium]|nr:hypothetical protein [Burkholderiales bacterium]